MVVGLALFLFASLASSVHAQEYAPVVDDRVEPRVVPAPAAMAEAERRGGWDLGLVVSAAYDDNIFLSATSPEADMVLRVAPTAAYTQGDGREGEGGFVKVAYRPTLVVYASNGSENRVDHQMLAAAGWRGKVTRLTYSGALQKLGDATAETGQATDRLEFSNEIRGAWIPREKITLELAAGNRQADYSDPSLYDSDETYGEVAVRYTYSPKTELGLIYQVGRLRVDRSDTQDTQQVTADIVWSPREKVRLEIEAGAERRKVGGESGINPVLEGRVNWTPLEGTEIHLAGTMREEASAYYAGQNYSVRGVAAGISQRVNRVWSVGLEGGYERNSYSQVSGSGTGGRVDRIWFLRPAVACRLSDESELSFFYRISDNRSSDSAFGYDQRVVGLEYSQKF